MLFSLEQGDQPLCYRLRYLEDKAAIVLIMEPNVARWLGQILRSGIQHIKFFAERLIVGPFADDIEKPWGYGSVIHPIKSAKGWPSWYIPLPRIIQADDAMDWKPGFEVSASLWLLFDLLQLEEQLPTKSRMLQNVSVSMCTQMGSTGIFCDISPKMRNVLRKSILFDSWVIEDAMESAFKHMDARDPDPYPISVEVRPQGTIFLTVPGDACGLYPTYHDDVLAGLRLAPHNVDTPLQQLTLLAGIAKLDTILSQKGGHHA